MNKSTSRKSPSQGPMTDRSKAKSTQKQIKAFSYTRQIIIRTDEPDIPQITILKVQRSQQNQVIAGFHGLQRVFQMIRHKKLYQGLGQICKHINFTKIRSVYANKVIQILKTRQKRLISLSWLKLQNQRIKHKSKLHTIRLLSKLSLLLINKNKALALTKMKSYIYDKIKRSISEVNQSNIKKAQANMQLKITKLRNQQFSEKFISICKKIMKINKNFIEISVNELEPNINKQIQRYQQLRKNSGVPINNEVVLIVLTNHLLTIKDLKKDLDTNILLVKQFQKQDALTKLNFYLQIQKQLEKADNQIRDSFQRNKKINENQLCKIVQNQLVKWNKNRQRSIYNSRLFISAIIVKMLKQNKNPLSQFLDKVQNFLFFSDDVKKLQQFKKTLKQDERGSLILLKITNKFIDLNTFGMQPIMQKGFSQNQQTFMQQINYIRQQIKDFITKFNNPSQRIKLKKTLSSRRNKAPQQLKNLYIAINQLISLIQNKQTLNKQIKNPKNLQNQKSNDIMRILIAFRDCLKQGNYQKWQIFLSNLKNRQGFQQLLQLLDKLNDILNEKIIQQTGNSLKEIEILKKSESKARQQLASNKIKLGQLQKKVKNLENSKIKPTDIEKDKQIQQLKKLTLQWQAKYKNLQLQFQKLENSRQKSLSSSKIQSQKQIKQLKKLIQIKDQQIQKIKNESNKLRDKSTEKSKIQDEKKALQNKIQNQLKQLQNTTQKLKNQLLNKNKLLSQQESKIKKYEIQFNKLQIQLKTVQNENKQLKNTSQSQLYTTQYEQVRNNNQNLSKRINQLTSKMEVIIEQLQSKEVELQNMRNTLLNEQKNQANLINLKNQYDSMVRRINILDNTIQGLKSELQRKNKLLQQFQKERIGQRKNVKNISKNDKTAQHSLQLIRELNKQLQKLKRSQITLQQINKQLQNVHHRSQDVQVLISRIQTQNIDIKKLLGQKDRTIFQMQIQINKLNAELNLANSSSNKLSIQLQQREQLIKRIENSIKDTQNLVGQELNNKKDYIKKLQGIIQANQFALSQLTHQNQKLKQKDNQNSNNLKNQNQKRLQQTLAQLNFANEKIRNLQISFNESQIKYFQLENIFKNQKSIWDNQKRNWQIQKQRIQVEIKKWTNETKQWQMDRQKLNNERENLEIQWKGFISKYQIATTQNNRLMIQLTQLNKVIQQLRYQISQMSGKSINIDNIVWLLSNITSNFLRIHPKPNQFENQKTSQQIFKDLMALKEQFYHKQNQLFINFQDYIVKFIQFDIGKYRYDLVVQINELSALKERLMQFLSNEIQISKKNLNYQYSYELKQRSTTGSKTFYQTPIKQSQIGSKISQQIRQIKQRTLHAQKLFESQQLKKI